MATICKSINGGIGYSILGSNQISDYEPEGCNCDNKTEYDRAAINIACTQALSLASQGQTLGRDKYPHAYNGISSTSSSETNQV
jgi:hypothetical protein